MRNEEEDIRETLKDVTQIQKEIRKMMAVVVEKIQQRSKNKTDDPQASKLCAMMAELFQTDVCLERARMIADSDSPDGSCRVESDKP